MRGGGGGRGRGALGFSVLRFWPFFSLIFGLCAKKLRFFAFGVRCSLSIFRFLEFAFRFSSKILMGLDLVPDVVSGFPYFGSGFYSM